MTIRKGVDWGEPGPLAPGAPVASDDATAAALLGAAGGPGEVGLVGGDLHRTLGSPRHSEGDLRGGSGIRFPVDLARVRLVRPDGTTEEACFLAHAVALAGGARAVATANTPFAAHTVVVMNGAFRGEANLGPRAHPNDGVLDVTEGRLPLGDVPAARRRMSAGSHLPHPALRQSRIRRHSWDWDTPHRLLLDGVSMGSVIGMEVWCEPDAGVVVA